MSSRGDQSDAEDVLDLIGGDNQDSDHGDELEDNQGQETEVQEDAEDPKKVAPPVVKRAKSLAPRLNTGLLKGPKGVHTLEKYFEGFKYHGKGREKEDLDRIMKRIEHYCHRLYPKFTFDDCLAKVEHLGNKRDLQVFLRRYRLDEISADDDFRTPEFVNEDDDDERREDATPQEEFDLLLEEQINKQRQNEAAINSSTAFDNLLATVNPPAIRDPEPEISDEIKERMERNRMLALERKQAAMKRLQELEAAKKNSENPETSGNEIPAPMSTEEISTDSNVQSKTPENDSNSRNEEMDVADSETNPRQNENDEEMAEIQTESVVKPNDNLITEIDEQDS